MINKFVKKTWWIFLGCIYLFFLLYRTIALKTGIAATEIGLIIALFQTIIQNWHIANRFFLRVYFLVMNLQFTWNYSAQFKAPKTVINSLNDSFFKTIVSEVINENPTLKKMKEDIKIYHDSSASPKTLITYSPLGINLCISKDYGSDGDNFGEQIDYDTSITEFMYLKVVGNTHIKYRGTKKLLDSFLSSLFSKFESKIPNTIHKKFTLEITSVESDSEYFKKLFIKGMEREDINKFSIEQRPGRYIINASDKRIYISSEYREDILKTASNMLFKLSL